MKEPKIYRRTRDGIFELCYYIGDVRKRVSLQTTDETKARVKFVNIIGEPVACEKRKTPKRW